MRAYGCRRLQRASGLLLTCALAACEGKVTNAGAPLSPSSDVYGAASAADSAANVAEAGGAAAHDASATRSDGAAPSADAELPAQDSTVASSADAGPTAQHPVFVAVGYAGLRVRSTDLGVTWSDAQELGGGGDDDFLLRSVSYGAGVFVAAGYRILTSPDGRVWTARTNPQTQWVSGLVYAARTFVAVGGYGLSLYSADGLSWASASGRGTSAARGLAYGNAMFVAATDGGTWYSSADGHAWAELSRGHSGTSVVLCGDDFAEPSACALPEAHNNGHTARGQGVYVSIAAGGGGIERSTDGRTWQHVYTSSRGLEAIAFGDASP